MTHTPGPWRKSEMALDVVVADDPTGTELWATEAYDLYGGWPIASRIAECNMPAIKATPALLAACLAHQSVGDHVGACPRCGVGANCVEHNGLARKADELTKSALAQIEETR